MWCVREGLTTEAVPPPVMSTADQDPGPRMELTTVSVGVEDVDPTFERVATRREGVRGAARP